jgi:hypothetical protein
MLRLDAKRLARNHMGSEVPMGTAAQDRSPRRGRFTRSLREFAYGFTGYEFARHALETRATMETLFLTVVVGDMIGLPILPSYYSLRLLPYVVPSVSTWKRRVLREREPTEEHDYDLHGV